MGNPGTCCGLCASAMTFIVDGGEAGSGPGGVGRRGGRPVCAIL